MKRFLMTVGAMAALTGVSFAQAPGATPPAATAVANPSRTVAVFNMSKVQKEFKKWTVYNQEITNLRVSEAKKFSELKMQIDDLKKKLENPNEPQKDVYEKQMMALNRQGQDMEIESRKRIEKISVDYLKVLHDDVRRVVQAVAEANQIGVIFAHPDALTDEEKSSPVYLDFKFRPIAAIPFYVGPNCDMTDVIVKTLNLHCPAPTGIVPAGGTAPAPGTPGVAPAGGAPRP
jgi:Skp family chaperone for outer membrane proteins